jgi:hypothetical protein
VVLFSQETLAGFPLGFTNVSCEKSTMKLRGHEAPGEGTSGPLGTFGQSVPSGQSAPLAPGDGSQERHRKQTRSLLVFGFCSGYFQSMGTATLYELREALERRFPEALPLVPGAAAGVGTGIQALDALLPGHGLARGRLTAWRPGGGATAVLRSACEAVVRRGERSAWIDGAGVQGADFWRDGPLLIRPATEREALASAEELLRSGGFALVVLTGVGHEAGREAVRLARAARAGGAAFVAGVAEAMVAHLRVVSRIAPRGYRWRYDPFGEPVQVVAVQLEVEASTLGWSGRSTFELPVRTHHPRLSPEPRLVDRRGAPAAVRWRRAAPKTRT